MKRVLVTGAAGFIGRHVCEALARSDGIELLTINRSSSERAAREALLIADVIIHLAGVNRPRDAQDFDINRSNTKWLVDELTRADRSPKIVFSSSTQASLDNPYGASKRAAEDELRAYSERAGARVVIFRLTNVFGKWSKPNYNSFVATLCDAVARDGSFSLDDPAKTVSLLYVDDAVEHLIAAALSPAEARGFEECVAGPVYQITLSDLVERVRAFHAMRQTLELPDVGDELTTKLYATYLSFLEPSDFAYPLSVKRDDRGSLAEFVRTTNAGQIFVSRTRPGVTRGNHYHHTKVEKFFVVEGDAVIRFRQIESNTVIEHRVSGHEYRVLDIPPGYTHSIENVGNADMVVVFWASEPFQPTRPDTIFLDVIKSQ